jgi:hypothetical protein
MTPLDKPVRRKTRGSLGYGYGSDTGKQLIVSLDAGDVITIRPSGTRRTEVVSIHDVYHWAIRSRCQRAVLEKARAKKAAKALKREAAELKARFRTRIAK